jgi:hypothetical protein
MLLCSCVQLCRWFAARTSSAVSMVHTLVCTLASHFLSSHTADSCSSALSSKSQLPLTCMFVLTVGLHALAQPLKAVLEAERCRCQSEYIRSHWWMRTGKWDLLIYTCTYRDIILLQYKLWNSYYCNYCYCCYCICQYHWCCCCYCFHDTVAATMTNSAMLLTLWNSDFRLDRSECNVSDTDHCSYCNFECHYHQWYGVMLSVMQSEDLLLNLFTPHMLYVRVLL